MRAAAPALASRMVVSRGLVLAVRPAVARPVLAARPAAVAAFAGARSLSAKTDTFLPVDQVAERVLQVVKQFPKVDPKKVTASANFESDLGLDSLDAVELVMLLEEEFVLSIPDDQAEKIISVADAIKFISTHPQAR